MSRKTEICLPESGAVTARSVGEQDPRSEQEVMTSEQADESISRFAEDFSGEKLTELMQTHKKVGAPPDSYVFSIEPIFGRYSYRRIGSGYSERTFFLDCKRGFGLVSYDPSHEDRTRLPEESSGLAIIGFDFGDEVNAYGTPQSGNPVAGRMNFTRPFPVILQLQGARLGTAAEFAGANPYDHFANARKRALDMLSSYKWERALIDVVLEWAKSENVLAVYSIPAELDCWQYRFSDKRLKLRYDVSAQRMGFTMQPNGLYGISLSSSTK